MATEKSSESTNINREDETRLTDEEIQSQDILLTGRCCAGRNKRHRMHPGTVAFRTFITSRIPHYLAATKSRSDLTRVVALSANSVDESGSRILKMIPIKGGPTTAGAPPRQQGDTPYYWKQVDKRQWRRLVGEAIRDRIKSTKRSNTGRLPPPAIAGTTTELASFTEILRDTMEGLPRKALSGKDVCGEEEGTPRYNLLLGNPTNNAHLLLVNQEQEPMPTTTETRTNRSRKGLDEASSPDSEDVLATTSMQVDHCGLVLEQKEGVEEEEDSSSFPVALEDSFLVHNDDIRPQDILLGIIPEARNHVGSRAFCAFVRSKTNAYIDAKETDLGRSVIVALATESLLETGARILRKAQDMDAYWVPVDKEKWALAIGRAIRYHVRQSRRQSRAAKESCHPKYATQISSFAEALQEEISVAHDRKGEFADSTAMLASSFIEEDQESRDMVQANVVDDRKQAATIKSIEGVEDAQRQLTILADAAKGATRTKEDDPIILHAGARGRDDLSVHFSNTRAASDLNIFIPENNAPQERTDQVLSYRPDPWHQQHIGEVAPADIWRQHHGVMQLWRLASPGMRYVQTAQPPSLQSMFPRFTPSAFGASILPTTAFNTQQSMHRTGTSNRYHHNSLPSTGVAGGAASLPPLFTMHHEALLRSQALKAQLQRQSAVAAMPYHQLAIRNGDTEDNTVDPNVRRRVVPSWGRDEADGAPTPAPRR